LAILPVYAEALKSDRIIQVEDVLTDPRTIDLLAYFTKNKISSLLDVPIRVGGILTGVLRIETGERRDWSDDEMRFAGEIADQLAQAVINNEKKKAIDLFEQRSQELERTNRVMVGRELRMVELKKEIERLKAGQP
jgi:GAF domain-containing protein